MDINIKKINLKPLLLFLFFFLLSFCYSFFFSVVYNDEIWNYGFSYNIVSGMVPYRDFNIIITPLYSFCAAFFIKIFGNYLFSLHIFNSLIVSCIFFILYKEMGAKSIILIPFVLLNSYPNYNIFCIFLLLLILCLNNAKLNEHYLLLSFVVGLSFLSKQTIGLFLFVPLIYYSNHKLKSIIVFLIPIIIFIIYLFFNNAFYPFVDYCFLGLFDFGQSNSIYFFLPIELIICIYLLFKLIKSNFKNRKLFYLLMFQVVTVPICDDYHFMIGCIPLLCYLIESTNINFYKIKYYFIISLFFSLMWVFVVHDYDSISLYKDSSSYLYGRNISIHAQEYIVTLSNYINGNKNNYDYIYFFSRNAYYIKLNIGYELSKYDLINNGNMGYKGSIKYINEIDNFCDAHECMFILLKNEFDGLSQTNNEVINYVKAHYNKIDETYLLETYNNI